MFVVWMGVVLCPDHGVSGVTQVGGIYTDLKCRGLAQFDCIMGKELEDVEHPTIEWDSERSCWTHQCFPF